MKAWTLFHSILLIVTIIGFKAYSMSGCANSLGESIPNSSPQNIQPQGTLAAPPKKPSEIDLSQYTNDQIKSIMVTFIKHRNDKIDYLEQYLNDKATKKAAIFWHLVENAPKGSDANPNKETKVIARSQNESLEIIKKSVSGVKEVAEVSQPFGMSILAPLISPKYVSSTDALTMNDNGEQKTEVKLRAYKSNVKTLTLKMDEHASKAVLVHSKANAMPIVDKTMPSISVGKYNLLSVEGKQQVRRFYFEKNPIFSEKFSSETLKLMMDNIDDHNSGQKALDYFLDVTKQGSVEETLHSLTTNGLNRYFMFQPNDHVEPVMARVLDIHIQSAISGTTYVQASGVRITVEIIKETDQSGVRRRLIRGLSEDEVNTIVATSTQERKLVREAFFDELTPMEIAALEKAHELGLRTFGYSDYRRHNSNVDVRNQFNSNGLGEVLTDPLHVLTTGEMIKNFGKEAVLGLMTHEEREIWDSSQESNIFDVMARMTPHEIFARFEKRDPNFIYIFAATEDGILKISPYGDKERSPQAITTRLSHGRRIYGAGYFTINHDGTIHLTLDAGGNRYQDYSQGGQGFRIRNGGIDSYMSYLFREQAGRIVENINERIAQSRQAQPDQNFGDSNFGFDDFEFSDFDEILKNFAQMKASKADASSFESWDTGEVTDRPLNFDDWCTKFDFTKSDQRLASLKKTHAYWVLKADPSKTSTGEIKKTYRSLALKFHPDREGKTTADGDAMSVVASAYALVKKNH